MNPHQLVCLWLMCTASVASGQQLLVFPAVTDEQPGLNGSLWVTTAMVVKVAPEDDVTIQRKWVALRGGGFVDDPATAPTWSMTGDAERLFFAFGGDLLSGSDDRVGAVALEVEGGEVLAHSNVMDVQRGEYVPDKMAFGQGQHVVAFREPLEGPSHIPWLGGCGGTWCSEEPPRYWSYLRNNIGIINPNPEPLSITGKVLSFGYYCANPGGCWWSEWYGVAERIHLVIPPYGWIQFSWVADLNYDSLLNPFSPSAGFVIGLTPDQEMPYYAYASVVFTPDPASGMPAFNDPMFIPAEPGFIEPWWDFANEP